MRRTDIQLHLKEVPNSFPNHIWGHTLKQRTQQRNWLIVRLHSAIGLCKSLGLDTVDLHNALNRTRVNQKMDSEATEERRKELWDQGII